MVTSSSWVLAKKTAWATLFSSSSFLASANFSTTWIQLVRALRPCSTRRRVHQLLFEFPKGPQCHGTVVLGASHWPLPLNQDCHSTVNRDENDRFSTQIQVIRSFRMAAIRREGGGILATRKPKGIFVSSASNYFIKTRGSSSSCRLYSTRIGKTLLAPGVYWGVKAVEMARERGMCEGI